MGHIAHLRKQFKSLNKYDYIQVVDTAIIIEHVLYLKSI